MIRNAAKKLFLLGLLAAVAVAMPTGGRAILTAQSGPGPFNPGDDSGTGGECKNPTSYDLQYNLPGGAVCWGAGSKCTICND